MISICCFYSFPVVFGCADGAKQSVINSIDANWVKYSRYTSPLTMGAAVGIAASLARGRAIILWSEYDMYSNDRVEAQVRPLFSGVSQGTRPVSASASTAADTASPSPPFPPCSHCN